MHQLELRKVPFVEIDIDKLTDDTKHDITDVFSELNMEEFAGMSAPGVKTATRLFWSCESLKKVGDISLPDAYECTCMFRDCTSLTHIGNIYMPKCYICTNMLSGCRNMQHIESMKISCGTAGAYHQFYEEFQLFNVKDALSNQDWLKDTSFDEHTK